MKYHLLQRLLYFGALIGIVLVISSPLIPSALSRAETNGIPAFPHAFYGYVTVNGAPAPDGTQVSATTDQGTVVTNEQNPVVTLAGNFGLNNSPLLVQGTGIPDGATITFYITTGYGTKIGGTAIYQAGSTTQMDMSVEISILQSGGTPGSSEEETSPESVETVPGTWDTSSVVDDTGTFKDEITIQSEDDDVTLIIQEGTKGTTSNGTPVTQVKFTKLDPDTLPEPDTSNPDKENVILFAYEIDAGDATFDQPVTLTLTYDPSQLPEGVNENELIIAWYDESRHEWLELPTSVDPLSKTLSVQLNHFSKYALIASLSAEEELVETEEEKTETEDSTVEETEESPVTETEEPADEQPEISEETPVENGPIEEIQPEVQEAAESYWWFWLIAGIVVTILLYIFYRYWLKPRIMYN